MASSISPASGITRPGETSRSTAIASRACHSSRTSAAPRRLRMRCMPEVRRHGSVRTGGPWKRVRASNSCVRPLHLALGGQVGGHGVADLHQHLDVEGGVAQPRLGQRAGGPVDGGVLLGQAEAEVVLDDGGEADPGQARRGARRARCRTAAPGAGPPRPGRAGPGWPRAAPTRRRRWPRRPARGRGRRSGRSARCPSPRGGSGRGRRAGRSGSPRRARRRWRPAPGRRRWPGPPPAGAARRPRRRGRPLRACPAGRGRARRGCRRPGRCPRSRGDPAASSRSSRGSGAPVFTGPT